jgi:uncharacterized protein (UPF0332 family)
LDNLAKYRLANAKDKLKSAKLLLTAGQYKDSIGRSYYAIFSAVRAVLAEEQYAKAEEFCGAVVKYLEEQ